MKLENILKSLGEFSIEEIRRDCDKSGTRVNILKRLMIKYNQSLKSAESFGFVGVGCITYAESRTATLKRRLDRIIA
jgi:hypothetical protein